MQELETAVANSKCLNCPSIKHAAGFIDDIKQSNEDVTRLYLSVSAEQEKAIAEQAFDDPVARSVLLLSGIDSAAEFSSKMADDIKAEFDARDEAVEGVLDDVAELTRSCDGPLKMRAEKAGQVVTATVCNSPEVERGDSCESAHINRRNAEQLTAPLHSTL